MDGAVSRRLRVGEKLGSCLARTRQRIGSSNASWPTATRHDAAPADDGAQAPKRTRGRWTSCTTEPGRASMHGSETSASTSMSSATCRRCSRFLKTGDNTRTRSDPTVPSEAKPETNSLEDSRTLGADHRDCVLVFRSNHGTVACDCRWREFLNERKRTTRVGRLGSQKEISRGVGCSNRIRTSCA